MADRVELEFRRQARSLVPRGSTLLVAVSGGGDSVALLHLLCGLTRGHGLRPVVAHLDHGLRRSSRADARFVARLAAELGLPLVAERREVGSLRRRDESPEEAARRVRRGFLLEAAVATGCARIATGHTLDDQAETILMRLARGAGPTAVTGMAACGPGPFVRPLLGIERAELRGYCARRGIEFREDPSNADLRYDRNRTRRLVIPLLNEALNPHAARHLVRAVRRAREDAEHLDALARVALDALAAQDDAGVLALDATRLSGLEPTIGRRIARIALQRAGADPRRIAARHVERLIDLAGGANGRRADLPGGVAARRSGGKLLLSRRDSDGTRTFPE